MSYYEKRIDFMTAEQACCKAGVNVPSTTSVRLQQCLSHGYR